MHTLPNPKPNPHRKPKGKPNPKAKRNRKPEGKPNPNPKRLDVLPGVVRVSVHAMLPG